MAKKKAVRIDRREEALTRKAIVDTAIELLDVEGEGGLTFRSLATRLATGAGAIYWHVANKEELLAAATDVVVARAITKDARGVSPRNAIRAVASGVFDAIDAHPWVGAQLARAPAQWAMLNVFERIGRSVQALGVPYAKQFSSVSALVNYIHGVGNQNAANARVFESGMNRTDFLDAAATSWGDLDPTDYAFTRTMAARLRDHDDRAEFLAGIDLIIAGIVAPR